MAPTYKRVVVILLALAGLSNGEEPDKDTRSHHSRAVKRRELRDAITLPLERLGEEWNVLTIKPEQYSGALYGKGTVNSKTGELRFTDAAEKIKFHGQWTLVPEFGDASHEKQTSQFHWLEDPWQKEDAEGASDQQRLRNLPFTRGGTVLCRLNAAKQNEKPFSDVYLLPRGDEWIDAAKELLTSPRLSEELAEAIRSNRLEALKKQRNPLLGTFAARLLLESTAIHDSEKANALKMLWEQHPAARPMFVALLMTPARKSKLTEQILEELVAGTTAEQDFLLLVEAIGDAYWFIAYDSDRKSAQPLVELMKTVRQNAQEAKFPAVDAKIELFFNPPIAKKK